MPPTQLAEVSMEKDMNERELRRAARHKARKEREIEKAKQKEREMQKEKERERRRREKEDAALERKNVQNEVSIRHFSIIKSSDNQLLLLSFSVNQIF